MPVISVSSSAHSPFNPLLADLVLPSLHSVTVYPHSPLLGAPVRNRTYLAIFKGRMQVGGGHSRESGIHSSFHGQEALLLRQLYAET